MRNCRLFYISNRTLYRTIMLKPRVLSSMSGIARFPGNAYKHMNSVLRVIVAYSLYAMVACIIIQQLFFVYLNIYLAFCHANVGQIGDAP